MEALILFAVALAVVVFTIILAGKKGRSQLGWGIGSFFFGIFALLILACLSNKNKERSQLAEAIQSAVRADREAANRQIVQG